MLDSITFDQIAADRREPGVLIEVRPARGNQSVLDYSPRALLIGQMLTGIAAAGSLQRITRRDQAAAMFGAGSAIADMIAAFLDANPTTELWAMGLAAPAGAAATGSIALAGTATAAGTLSVWIAGRRVAVPVATGATAAAVATALNAAIGAATGLPVTASVATATVTLAARHIGELGNGIDLRLNYRFDEATPSGLTPTVTAMSGGTGVPDVAAALASIAAERFTDIALAWSDSTSLGALSTELARRYNALVALDAHAYVGLRGNLSAILAIGNAQNSPHLSLIGANASPSPAWSWAASLCGRAAFHLANDPARQLRSLTLPGILPPAPGAVFIASEAESLLRDGVSTWTVAAGEVVLSRVISAYQVTTLGVADTAWLDITVAKVLSRIRWDWRNYLLLTYPRHKLADDGSPAAEYGDAVVTPRIMSGAWTARCKLYERQGWIEDVKRTAAESHFVRDTTDRNRMNAVQKVRIIGNLIVFAAALEFEA